MLERVFFGGDWAILQRKVYNIQNEQFYIKQFRKTSGLNKTRKNPFVGIKFAVGSKR